MGVGSHPGTLYVKLGAVGLPCRVWMVAPFGGHAYTITRAVMFSASACKDCGFCLSCMNLWGSAEC